MTSILRGHIYVTDAKTVPTVWKLPPPQKNAYQIFIFSGIRPTNYLDYNDSFCLLRDSNYKRPHHLRDKLKLFTRLSHKGIVQTKQASANELN